MLCGGDAADFPRFVVLGNQSSGKTSALEALIGMDILPKGQDMITRRPLEVTMVRTGTGQWVEFEDRDKYFDFEKVRTQRRPTLVGCPHSATVTFHHSCYTCQVKNRIREENLSINGVSHEPLRLTVYAPHFHNLTLVDLPGVWPVPSGTSSSHCVDLLCCSLSIPALRFSCCPIAQVLSTLSNHQCPTQYRSRFGT